MPELDGAGIHTIGCGRADRLPSLSVRTTGAGVAGFVEGLEKETCASEILILGNAEQLPRDS